MLLLHDKHQQ